MSNIDSSKGNNDDPERLKNKGNEFFSKGDFESALNCYQKSVELDPNYIGGWNNLGLTLLKLGRIDEAIEAKKKKEELQEIVSSKVTKVVIEKEPIESNPEKEMCLNCGIDLPYTKGHWPQGKPKICPECGVRVKDPIKYGSREGQGRTHEEQLKNPTLAGLLSIIPGLGQLYNGQLGKGLLLFFGTVIGFILIIPGFIIWLYGIYEAYKTSNKMNYGDVPFKKINIFHTAFYLVVCIIGVIVVISVLANIFGVSGTIDSKQNQISYPVQTTQPTLVNARPTGIAPVKTETPLNVYRNQKWEFSIGYPQNWVATEYQDPYLELFGPIYYLYPFTKVDFASYGTRDNVLASVIIDEPEGRSIEDYYVKYVSELENEYFIDITKHHAQVQLDNHTLRGYRIDYVRKSKQDVKDVKKVIQVFTIDNDNVYIMSFEARLSVYDSQLTDFERMIESFKTM